MIKNPTRHFILEFFINIRKNFSKNERHFGYKLRISFCSPVTNHALLFFRLIFSPLMPQSHLPYLTQFFVSTEKILEIYLEQLQGINM